MSNVVEMKPKRRAVKTKEARSHDIQDAPTEYDTQQGPPHRPADYLPVAMSDANIETPLMELDFDDEKWVGAIYSDPDRLPLTVKDYCFHSHDAKGHPTGIVDNRVFTYITHTQDIFVIGGIPYIYRGGYYQMDPKGTIIKTMIKACCLEQFMRSTTIDRVFKLFLQDYKLEKTAEDLNAHNPRYINFVNGMYDPASKIMYSHSPSLMSVNQIPWVYEPDKVYDGTEIEAFLEHAFPTQNVDEETARRNADDREMLLEYIGLCCTTDTRQQKMLVICGEGGTGKSTIINLIQELVGKQNTSNVAMSKLSLNFQAIRMMGKLLNACADLEIDALDDVSTIKKLIGEDAMSDSYKGKDVISFDNYAKLLFSTNELPVVRNEKTEGFFRRLLVLTMNNKPDHRDPRYYDKLKAEIPYLLHLAMDALARMYERGYILESENSEDRVRRLREESDTIEGFLGENNYVKTFRPYDRVNRNDLFQEYVEYCKEWECQAHTKKNFNKALRNKGLVEAKSGGERFFTGLKKVDPRVDENGFFKMPDDEPSAFDEQIPV